MKNYSNYVTFILLTTMLTLSIIPPGYSQIGSDLYEGFFVEYEISSFNDASNPTLKSKMDDFILSFESIALPFDGLKIEITKITNQGVTLERTINKINFNEPQTYTYSELSSGFVPFVVDTDSSRGDSIRIDFPDLPFVNFIDIESELINGISRELILFAGETKIPANSDIDGVITVIITYDKQTGFLTDFLIVLDVETDIGTAETGVGFTASNISSGSTIPPPVNHCPPGTHLENGVCVADMIIPPPTCPTGKYLENGVCVEFTKPTPPDDNGVIIAVIIIVVVIGVVMGVVMGVVFLRRKKSSITVSNNAQQYAAATSSDSKFCYNCQTPALAHNKFCKKCGKAI